jgi:Fic family protein
MKNFKAGILVNQGYYKSFQPSLLNREWQINDMSIITLLSKADRFLGRLDMYSEHVDVELFTRMHVVKEATMSSRIEGTRTNMEEALLDRDDVNIEKRDDWEEVNNYINAMNEAINMLSRLPFSVRLLKKTHEILLQGVRGQHKMPGEFRKSQNWIGGASINNAVFVPPVHSSIPELMSDLEIFANNEDDRIPDLVKIALMHYQFETIHPFLDGNGRTGRLMITLYLVSKGILKRPVLYLSNFFEKNRTAYYDHFTRVRTTNDTSQWVGFFLHGIVETARKGVETLDAIMQLKQSIDRQVNKHGKKGNNARVLLHHLYKNPVISQAEARNILGMSRQTTCTLVAIMEKEGILKEITGAGKKKLYLLEPYIKLFANL